MAEVMLLHGGETGPRPDGDAAGAKLAAAVELRPIPIQTGTPDRDGRLVLVDGRLVAVLVRLSELHPPEHRGRWSLEIGFGPCADGVPGPFPDLADAEAWVLRRTADGEPGFGAVEREAVSSQAAAVPSR